MKKPDKQRKILKALYRGEQHQIGLLDSGLFDETFCLYNRETGLYHDVTAGGRLLFEFVGPGIKRNMEGVRIQVISWGDHELHFFQR